MAKRTRLRRRAVRNIIVISDTHCGDALGLCPPDGVLLDDGGTYRPSRLQRVVLGWWEEFWGEWVPRVTRGEPFAVVHNGDAIDGDHHKSVTQITHNLTIQRRIAEEVLAPVVAACEGRYYHIRGTEAHVGKSAADEEALARSLGAIPTSEGQHARWELWAECGDALIHFLHHIGTTGSAAYEATAVHKELTESFVEAGRWNRRPPDIIVRSHRHRNITIDIPTANQRARAIVTPGWQLKTPFVFRLPGARLSQPQFGGILIRQGDETFFTDSWVRSLDRGETEVL